MLTVAGVLIKVDALTKFIIREFGPLETGEDGLDAAIRLLKAYDELLDQLELEQK